MKQGGFLQRRTQLKRGTSQLKRTYLNRGTSQLKKTQLRKVGPVGRANLAANKKLKTVLAGITSCEVGFLGCYVSMFMTNAHRHKRSWYKGDVDLLSAREQVIRACVWCHDKIEHDADLTEEVFMQLRGPEDV